MIHGVGTKEIDALVQRFAAAVIEQGRVLGGGGDAREGNRAARRYIATAKELLALGDEAIDRFAALLWHPNDQVKVMAAAFLLKERTHVAVDALRIVLRDTKGEGLAALGAQMTLERYEAGNLSVD